MTDTIEVRNPRTGELDYEFAPPTEEELTALTRRLRDAGREWSARDLDERLDALQEWKTALSDADWLVEALTADTGRRDVSAREVELVRGTIDRVCETAPAALESAEGETSLPSVRYESQTVPYPLVGVVSPWNVPLLLALIDAIPALAAGCAVVVKPSEITPRFVDPLRETLQGIPGLAESLAFVQGAGATGAALVDRVDAVAFTGSVETGEAVATRAAESLTPAFLELGGKDPAVVLESADIERAAAAILWGATANVGQSCQAIERVYVHERHYEAFVDRLVEQASAVELAYPAFDDGELGPIISLDQVDTIRAHLDNAVDRGATVRCGGDIETLGGGRWLRPTVLTDVDHSMAVCTDETFGPVIPVIPFGTVDEAVELANDTVYGLSAAVFGVEAEALSVGRRIDAGAISVNDAALTALVQETEKEAFGKSGLGGSRFGAGAVERFVRTKALLVNDATDPSPWWYGDGDEPSAE